MEIKIKDKPSNEFYDEFLYITTNYKKIIKYPDRKVDLLTKSIRTQIIIIIVGLLFEIMFYFITNKDHIYLYLAVILAVTLFIYIVYYFTLKKRINIYRDSDHDDRIVIDKKGITLKKKNQDVSLGFDAIDKIVINKYSIVVIPKDLSLVFLGIPADYKDDVIDGIKENHRFKLLVDNTDLYK